LALVIAALALCAAMAASGCRQIQAAAVSRPVAKTSQKDAGKRIFLTKAQVSQAVASGAFDRPVKSLLSVKSPLRFGDFSWDERGVPAGPTWVRVDLNSQLISVFRAGHEIGTAVVVYGADGLPTPTGKFPILAKLKNHRSSTYDAPMPYTLRLTRDGVSIHGSNVRWGTATHGCIGVPLNFAQRLFTAAHVGDEVEIMGQRKAG